jgi:hypothetical protein
MKGRRALRGIRRRMPIAVMAAAALVAGGAVSADVTYTRADADSLQRKIDQIVQLTPGAGHRSKLTPVTEREVNAYLRFQLRDQVPKGMTEPVITIVGDGRVTGRATVDLDEVSRANRSGSWLDPMRLLSGRLPVSATGLLETRNGTGKFLLESATVSGLPVPKTVLQQIVSYYSRSPEDPDGIGLDDPFLLPAQIQEIRVQPGQAIVVQ